MSDKGWQVAYLDEVGNALTGEYWAEWAEEPAYGERWRSIRRHFGIAAFGVQAYETDAGRELIVRHHELDDGQEELFFVHRGRARFICDGEELEIAEGGLLCVAPEVVRQAWALETPTVVFMVGGTPGKAYSPGPH